MIKILLIFLLLFSSTFVYADRNTATTTAYRTSSLVKSGEGKIYSIEFVATSNNGSFIVYDGTAATGGSGSDLSAIKAEGSEATSGNGKFRDYSNKPLEFHTGLYLVISNGYVIISYE